MSMQALKHFGLLKALAAQAMEDRRMSDEVDEPRILHEWEGMTLECTRFDDGTTMFRLLGPPRADGYRWARPADDTLGEEMARLAARVRELEGVSASRLAMYETVKREAGL